MKAVVIRGASGPGVALLPLFVILREAKRSRRISRIWQFIQIVPYPGISRDYAQDD